MSKVPVQKGPINPNPGTMKTQTYKQRVEQSNKENSMRRGYQSCELKTPKK